MSFHHRISRNPLCMGIGHRLALAGLVAALLWVVILWALL